MANLLTNNAQKIRAAQTGDKNLFAEYTNIKIAIDDSRMILPLIRDLILRCPYFCSPALISFGTKIRPPQLQRLAVSAPGGARWLPPSRARFQIPSEQNKKAVLRTTSLFWKGRIK